MRPILQIRDLTLGAGRPKICVPIVGRNLSEILTQAQKLKPLNPDMAEWRIDWFAGAQDPQLLQTAMNALREALPQLPLLFTFRTRAEGGEQACTNEQYLSICRQAIQSSCCDLVDLELFSCGEALSELTGLAKNSKVTTIFSSHHFDRTPPFEELLTIQQRMEQLGADICKIAVMPLSAQDVVTLLSATIQMSETACCPVITMSMGALGAVSRICGELTGCCLTFGAAEQGSAPGQIPVSELRHMLEALKLTP